MVTGACFTMLSGAALLPCWCQACTMQQRELWTSMSLVTCFIPYKVQSWEYLKQLWSITRAELESMMHSWLKRLRMT